MLTNRSIHGMIAWVVFLSVAFSHGFVYGQDATPRLGLSVAPLEGSPILLQHLKLSEGEGVMIGNIVAGSELDALGLLQGDILLAVDGHLVSRPSDLMTYVSSLPHGATITLDVIQKGDHRQISLKLDNLPDEVVWKYAAPVRGPGRMGISSGRLSHPPSSVAPLSPGMSSQRMVFRSQIQTPEGIKGTTVVIVGDPGDGQSEVEVTVGDQKYMSRVADIDGLPAAPREAARRAIAQSGQFFFSFGTMDDSAIEEMMRQHREQMDLFEQMFFRRLNSAPPAPVQPPAAPLPVMNSPIKS
ncbi:MAG: PDZ domain-containing protein [Proteobacteria bacterium]|nr:PDZ domain-containing protein [Pseudomonadota bacterium]